MKPRNVRKAPVLSPEEREKQRLELDRVIEQAGICIECYGAGCGRCPVIERKRRVVRGP